MYNFDPQIEWQRIVDLYQDMDKTVSDEEVAMSKKIPPQASREDVIHHIMHKLRKEFKIDSGDENPDYISDPQIKKARQQKRRLMRNRTSEILKELGQNGLYSQPDAGGEGQIFGEAIKRLARGQCGCGKPFCPAKGGCSCGDDKCDGSCGGSCGGSGHSGSASGGCSSGSCGHKKP